MARQLYAQGEAVAFLGLLDAYGPAYPEYASVKNRADHKISVHLNALRVYGRQGQLKYLWGRARHRGGLTLSRVFADVLLKLHLPLPGRVRYEYIAWLIDQAARNYPCERSYPGTVTLFRASTQPDGAKPDPTLGWGKLVTGALQTVDVAGTHNSIMMHEPHVAELVRTIDDHLKRLHHSTRSANS
jgi:thioesterase domain-containing protein